VRRRHARVSQPSTWWAALIQRNLEHLRQKSMRCRSAAGRSGPPDRVAGTSSS
jgi:hypothetical protein